MYRLRKIKSEFTSDFCNKKIKRERSQISKRFSRRLRKLPPEFFELNFDKQYGDNVMVGQDNPYEVLSEASSHHLLKVKKSRSKKWRYPQTANPKEIVSILSAPKLTTYKKKPATKKKSIKNIPSQKRPRSVGANVPMIQSTTSQKLIEKRHKYVLAVLNQGNMKDIEKLPTVGSKTAERIILFRQLRGPIDRIAELAKMPKFPKRRFHNFVAQNYLKLE